MPPTVILIRHDWSLPDPALTELGKQQCRELADHLQNMPLGQEIELIVVSPMRRTLDTALSGLGWLMDRGVPTLCRGDWQENSSMPCDTGSALDVVRGEFPRFDYSQVYAEWPQKTDRYEFSAEAVHRRGQLCRQWLRSRPEKVIAIVSHSAFLRLGVTSDQYANADYRIYDFGDDGDQLLQHAVTKERGGGLGKSPKTQRPPTPSDFEI